MCGIVFAGGSLSSSDLEIFNQMLYCDVFRGAHATGVFAKRQGEPVKYCKTATEPYPFMHSDEYLSLSQGETKYVVAPAFLVGHNRHATRGNAGDSKNAHPFQHGNITLVHNGTLLDQDLLPDSSRFVVDSENICYSIDKIGAAATIQKLDGAYTLIWHDASDDTLHIIRNSERPFHLAKVGSADWFGASEEDMLMWLLKRSKSHKARITEHFECEVGVEYIFDVSGPAKKCTFKEKIKHDLPTFTAASRYGYGYSRGWQRDSSISSRVTTTYPDTSGAKLGREAAKANEREKQNAVAIEANIEARLDGRLTMCPHSWFPYTSSALTDKRGRITGWVYQDNGEYYEVDVHSCPEGMWEDCCDDPKAMITGTVVSIQKINGTVRVILSGPSLVKDGKAQSGFVSNKPSVPALPAPSKEPELTDEDNAPFEVDLPASFVMDNGNTMTKEQWGRHDHSKCGGCDQEIPWKDAVKGKAVLAYNCFWHEKCLAAVLDDNAGNEPDTFICASCGKTKRMEVLDGQASAYRGEDICENCGEVIRKKIAENRRSQEAEKSPIKEDQSLTGVSVIYVDKTTTAIIDDADGFMHKVFTREEFNRMVKMRGSDTAKFEQLGECYVERRSQNIFAYRFKRGTNSAAGQPKEDNVVSMAASFSSGAKAGSTRSTGDNKLSKVLTNGSKTLHINKALWAQIGQCTNCCAQVPWRDAEECALTVHNRIICPDCRGK